MKLFYEKYIKLAHIGKGANAHVYKVRHAELGYVRAIKILNDYIEGKNEKLYQSFLKECKTLLTIGNGCNPNIVRIYGPDLIDNHAIVEMDYVQGATLDSYIKRKGFLEYEEIKTFIHDIVGALAYTHHDIYKFLMNPEDDDLQIDPNDGQKFIINPEKEAELVKKYGIAHNDLHSNNIMRRDYDGHFVLLDFGLAVQDGKCVKSSRMADGNPEYQAPEKFDSETVDPRSDVYSLGILMYEMLAGRVPFELEYDEDGKVSRRALNEVLNRHLIATPPPILNFRKQAFEKNHPGINYKRDYPEWLDELIMKCLSKKPEGRFADAKDLRDAIVPNLNNDDTGNFVIKELKNTITQLEQQYQDEKSRNVELAEECQEIKKDNEHLLKQLDATKVEKEKIQSLKDTISKITEQYLSEKYQKEQLSSHIDNISEGTVTRGSKNWKIICGLVTGFLLCCIIGIWYYKDSQLEFVARNLTNTLLFAESKGVAGDEINQMLDSLNNANIEFGEFSPQISYNRQTIDSLQTLIENLQKSNDPNNSSEKISKMKKEIDDLNEQIAALKSQSRQVEYKIPPEMQKDLNQLRKRNKELEGQVQRFLNSID